jgi:hypothetical protein
VSFSSVDGETVEAIIRALMPYEDAIKSERHRKMARQNRERDVVTVMRVLADCGYRVVKG